MPKIARNSSSHFTVGLLSTYVPRECGIATFSQDVLKGIKAADPNIKFVICAISDADYVYSDDVSFEIKQQSQADYSKAAVFFNDSEVDVVLIQHEFGIFGGYNGSYLLDFVRQLKKPVAIVLHTVPMHKSTRRQTSRIAMLRKLFKHTDKIFVTIPSAIRFFRQAQFSKEMINKMSVIPHGAPIATSAMKRRRPQIRRLLEVDSKSTLVLTYGLINQKKGIHHAIQAMRTVLKKNPNTRYIIAGRMHPNKSDDYMSGLRDYVAKYGMEKNVTFLTKYLSLAEILDLLIACDIYVVPYLTKGQVSSGTLAYAVAAGKAIVATKFAYAEDTLAEGRGLLVDFSSPKQIAAAILSLTNNHQQKEAMQSQAEEYGSQLAWNVVGKQYSTILRSMRRI